MKRSSFRAIRATVVLMVIAVAAVLIAPSASAAAPSATATLTGGPVSPGGTDASFTFSITPSSRTLGSFTLSAPAGWLIRSVGSSSAGGNVNSTDTSISVTGLSVSGSAVETIPFVATACVAGSSSWEYDAADTQGRTYNTTSPLTTSVSGASCSLDIVNQPTNAKQNQLITGNPFQGGADNVTVQLLDGNGALLTTYPVSVTFSLATTGVDENGQGLVGGTLSVTPESTVGGVATFDTQLQIAEKNEAEFTAYSLQPQTTVAPSITGPQSNGFDIWETQCAANSNCSVSLRGAPGDLDPTHAIDLYTSPAGSSGDLSASKLPFDNTTNIVCAGQTVIFGDSVFEHEFTGSGAVFLKSHVTRADMKKAANNGQAHVQWCVGLPVPWSAAGGAAEPQDTNGDAPLGILYVGIAPACPNASPQLSAPCITRQYGDGNGGSYTEGFLPPDPTRRT